MTEFYTNMFNVRQDLTLEQLSKYNGRDGNPAYIAVNGVIYDVTDIDYCLDHIDNNSTVIIIDAASSEKTPGTVTQFTMNDNITCTNIILSAHNHSIIEAAKTTITSNNIIIIGIEPMTIDYQLGLSDTLSKAFEQIVEDVKTCLTKVALN